MKKDEVKFFENYFFTFNEVKYVVVFEENKRIFYKLVNDEFAKLTEEENKELNNYFKRTNGFIFYSQRARDIIDSNDYLEKKELLYPLISRIEKVIPEGYEENFYKNLAFLDIEYNTQDLLNPKKRKNKMNSLGYYSTVDNCIEIGSFYLSSEYKSRDELFQEYMVVLTHELLHMASTNRDNLEEVVCGFQKVPTDSPLDDYDCLNEGLTDSLAYVIVPNANKGGSGYGLECCLVEQVSLIIGSNVLLESYFGNKGIEPLCEKLNEFIPNNEHSHKLFNLMELDYQLRKRDKVGKQNILPAVQNALINYLDIKLTYLTENPEVDPEKICDLIEKFEERLLTPEKLEDFGVDSTNYVGLDKNISKFNDIKNSYSNYFYLAARVSTEPDIPVVR